MRPRTTPCVSLPIKEENEDNNTKAPRALPRASLLIKEENKYNNTKAPRTSSHVSLPIKEEYQYDDTKDDTTKNVEKQIEVAEKKGDKDKNRKVNENNNITKQIEFNPSKIRGPLVARKTCAINKRKYATQKNNEQGKQTDNKGIDENIWRRI